MPAGMRRIDGMANSVDPNQTALGLHSLISPVSQAVGY